jgi:Peptidase family M28
MPPDTSHLRQVVEHLAAIERPSASGGERRAAEWIRDHLASFGLQARVETERAVGNFYWPLGLMNAAAVLAAAKGGRAAQALVGAAAAAGVFDDVTNRSHLFRKLLPHRETYNVVAEAGDPAGSQTIVLMAHHDAAHGGLIFRPELIEWPADRWPERFEQADTLPPVMALVAAGPALVALGGLTGIGALRRAGVFLAAGSAAAMADIGAHRVVPGANDNLTAVAVLAEIARLLAEQPVEGVRVLLLSTGSEESLLEGMRGFARRHFPSLPTESTRFLCVETVGSPELCLVEGEGMVGIRDYPEATREWLAACAEQAGVHVRRGLRTSLATDGLLAMRAGYPSAVLASITRYKHAANYHSQSDVPENVVWDSVADAVRVCEQAVRSLSRAAAEPARSPARA